jgi:hypothetical protein
LWGDRCRDGSRRVAVGRDHIEGVQLFDLRNVARNRLRRHQVLVAERRRDLAAIEMTDGAIALQASDRAGMPGLGVALGHDVKRERVVAVEDRRC